ncbi:MAG: MBL fold metallo-hydrolase [Clostridia bacterium]|nr:MBL fold metallo-hydrolase [Clostridia bacterium]
MKINNVGSKLVNRYLLELPDGGYCLIDTGYKWEYEAFSSAMQKIGAEISKIRFVVLTHAHADHAGFLKELLSVVPATVIYHPDQAPRLHAGKNDCNVYVSTFPILLTSKVATVSEFVDKTQCYPSLDTTNFVPYTENPLADYGVEFFPLVGHTAADLCLKVGSDFFCGDVFNNAFYASHRFPTWIEDKFALIRSWEQVVSIKDIVTVYPGHGKPFPASKIAKDLAYWKDKGVFPLQKKKKNQLSF